MARLTWDSVRGPDFSGISDSYRNMSALLGNAVQGGLGMIDTVRDTNTGAADRAIMQRLAGVQDLSQLNPTDIIGADGSNASLGVLEGVANRQGTLLDWATTKGQNERLNYTHNRTVEGNALLDAPENRDRINRARSFAVSGNIAAAQQELAGMNLRPDQFAEVIGDVDASGTRALARDVVGQRLTQDRWGFGNEQREYADGRNANALVANVMRTAATPADAREALEDMLGRNEISPEAFQQAVGGLGQAGYGNVYAPVGSGGGGGAASGGGAGFTMGAPQQAVASSLGSTFSPIVTAGFLGNFHAEGGYDGAQGDGGSAGGIAQWRGERRENFKQQIGKDPTQATPEEQMRFVQWEMENPGKAGMTVGQRDAILAAKTPGEAARLIDQYYERSSGAHRDKRIAAADAAYATLNPATPAEASFSSNLIANSLSEGVGQNNATGIVPNYRQLVNDTRSANEVATSMIGEGGAVQGTNKGYMLRQINDIVRDSGGRINAAQAGAMIEQSLDDAGGGIRRFGRGLINVGGLFNNAQPALSGNQQIQQGRIDSMVQEAINGGTGLRASTNEVSAATQQALETATTARNNALAQLQAVQADGRTRNIAAYEVRLQQAEAALQIARAAADDPSIQPEFDKPPVARTSYLGGMVQRAPTGTPPATGGPPNIFGISRSPTPRGTKETR